VSIFGYFLHKLTRCVLINNNLISDYSAKRALPMLNENRDLERTYFASYILGYSTESVHFWCYNAQTASCLSEHETTKSSQRGKETSRLVNDMHSPTNPSILTVAIPANQINLFSMLVVLPWSGFISPHTNSHTWVLGTTFGLHKKPRFRPHIPPSLTLQSNPHIHA
jgi:hypothetical protein